jgi:hypothetical protein
MKYALLVVEKSANDMALLQSGWPLFKDNVENAQSLYLNLTKPAGRLGENCWLLSLATDTGLLAFLVELAQTHRLPHRVLYIPEEPLEYSFSTP